MGFEDTVPGSPSQTASDPHADGCMMLQAMSVRTLEEDRQFIEQFQANAMKLIEIGRNWENVDATAWERAQDDCEFATLCIIMPSRRKSSNVRKSIHRYVQPSI
jgi:hypothetical protein